MSLFYKKMNFRSQKFIVITWIIKIWVFPKIGIPQNGWFIMENLIKMDDLGVPLFFGNIHIENSYQVQVPKGAKQLQNGAEYS